MQKNYEVLYQDRREQGLVCIHRAPTEKKAFDWADGDIVTGNVYYVQPVACFLTRTRPLPPTEVTAVWKDGSEVFHGTVEKYKRFQYAVGSIGKKVLCLSKSEPHLTEGTLVCFVSLSQSKQPVPFVRDSQGVDHVCLGPVLLDLPNVRAIIEKYGAAEAMTILTALNQVRISV